jgi:ABC-type transporter Mla maintaining outer membrane lipid asymmetry permease subunit MlaE
LLIAYLLAAAIGDQPVATSVWSFITYVEPRSIANGLLRMTVFGLILGLSSCHAGAAVERSADRSAGAIGRAVYLGSVLSLAGVLIANAVLSLVGGTS